MAKSIKRIFASILTQLSLNGLNSIIGRGVVVHAGRDDMGRVRIYILIMIVINVGENNDHGWDGRVVGDVSRVKHILLLSMMTLPIVREVTTEA